MNHFSYLSPELVETAMHELSRREGLALLAGGTALNPLLKCGARKPSCLLNLGRIQELKMVAAG
ncbi:MAG: binding domain in molybdopterin dehydrogenase, partial [Deltaproteobacteria bacterium]|nr:binding domain in molybdopterin dehydrogenase [Deltaproteobacteria bacterium]